MKKRKFKSRLKTSFTRNPFASLVRKMKPKVVKSKKVYSRKNKTRNFTRFFPQGGYFNDFLRSCRSGISHRRVVHAFQTGYQKSAGVRRVCRHWSKPSTYRHVCRNIRRHDGSSYSWFNNLNSIVRNEKAHWLQKAKKKWFQVAMGKRSTHKHTPCNISID